MIINWMSKIPKQTYRFVIDDVIMPIIQAWKEIENPIINEEIKNVINKYHIEYLKYSCRVFVNIAIFTLLFNLTIIVLFMNGNNLQTNSAKFIVPMLLTVLFGIKFITDKYIEACKHVFPCLILCFGTALTIENTFFSQFKIYEIWLMFYFFCSLISISICFDWKRIVLAFWIVKFNYIIVMTLTYGPLTIQFYLGIMYACITYPIVSIIITKKILDLLKCIQEKKELIQMIKIVLKSFPEIVIIQEIDSKNKNPIIKFANDVAKSELITYPDPEECDISNENLHLKVTTLDENMESCEDENNDSLTNILINEANKLINEETEVITQIRVNNENLICENVDDSKYFMLKTLKVNWENSKDAFMHVFINTTHFKKLEKAKATNECLRVMFSSISHEFRTPINAFSNALSLLEMNNDSLEKLTRNQPMSKKSVDESLRSIESNKKFMKICFISSKLLLSLTEDILDMAKMEAGMFSLCEEQFLVGSLVTEIKYIFEMQCDRKGIRFDVFCAQELMERSFVSDMGRIKQVLMNLISNAYKFTDHGGIDLRISLKTKADSDGERVRYLEFTVSDTGVGIAKEDTKNLFTMFGMIKKNNKFNVRGTGLGLTISKRLVESMGGSIEIESEESKGTDVVFTIFEKNKGTQ